MRIGIITFQRADNCGAILQCYALYRFLSKYTDNVEVIDYRNNNIEDVYLIFPKFRKNIFKLLMSYFKNCTHYKLLVTKKESFNKFRNLIPFSKSYTKEYIKQKGLNYNLIIAGSDQIWNPNITKGFDDIYYLNFPGIFYKATYAVSMGNISNPSYSSSEFNEMISKFDYISMREKDSTKYISNLLSKEIPQVLDPTLLLSKNEWSNLVKSINISIPQRYILLYYIEYNQELSKIAENLSLKFNIPVIYLNFSLNPKKRLKCKSICRMEAGPLEFVKLIQNAEIVVTSSFHATAFSCIFEKDLHLMTHSTTGARVISLAEMFKINDRIYTSYEDFINKYSTQKKIVYSKDDFNIMYKKSIEYLNKITSLGEKEKND